MFLKIIFNGFFVLFSVVFLFLLKHKRTKLQSNSVHCSFFPSQMVGFSFYYLN